MGTDSDTPTLPIWIVVGWATIFLVGTDLFVVSPFLPLIGKEIDRSPQSLTVLVSVFSVVYAVASPIQGWVAERLGPKAVLIFGVSALAIANAYTGIAPDFPNLVVSRTMAGFAAASISPMVYTLTANNAEPARRASRLAIVNSGLVISLILGAPVGLMLGSLTEWRWVFLGLAVLLIVMIPINVMTWAQVPAKASRSGTIKSAERLADSWPFLAGMIAWAASVYMTYTLLGTALETRLQLGVWTTSLILSAFGLGATVGVLSGGKLADRIGAPYVVRLSFVAIAIMFCMSAAAFHFGVVTPFTITLFLIALFAYGFFPAIQAMAANAFAARRATVLGLLSSSLYVGITLGSFVGGVIFDTFGMACVLIASAITAVVGLLATWALAAKDRTQNEDATIRVRP
ncbi:MAG: MFS transporter [Thermomonas sp.]|uniref:MFS transporter n=1 Tax=Thermomonas sp. TaxID=1971895 RepID=UPI0039E66DAD